MRFTGAVLVASDLKPHSDDAIAQAAALARASGSPLVACHVVPEVYGIRPLFPQLREEDREVAERVRKMAAGALEAQLVRALGREAERPEVRIESGSTHSALLEMADEIGAGIVVLSLAADRAPGLLAGVAERVARHAGCPLWLAAPAAGRAVLAATDFSDPALPAIELAQEEATRRGLPLVVMHAIDMFDYQLNLPEIVTPLSIDRVLVACREDARERLDDVARRVAPGAKVMLREGPVVEHILAAAKEEGAGLIVLGTHGRAGLGRMALGSVAEGVMRAAECSVLVVRLKD